MFVISKFGIWNFQVIGYSDTDVAEYLYKSKSDIDSLFNYLCKDLTKACSTKPPPVPKVNCNMKLMLQVVLSYDWHTALM